MADTGKTLESRYRIKACLVIAELIQQCLNGTLVANLPERLHCGAAQYCVSGIDVVDQRVSDVTADFVVARTGVWRQ